MNEEILKLADLSNVKVGDTIWTIMEGYVKVKKTCWDEYSINAGRWLYTINGKTFTSNKYPSAFTKNPFETIGFQERWMMVSSDEIGWVKRKVFTQKNNRFVAWNSADNEESVLLTVSSVGWKYAEEIKEPKELELTLEQIAEKFGVSVESIKIRK